MHWSYTVQHQCRFVILTNLFACLLAYLLTYSVGACDATQVNTLYSYNDARGRDVRGRADQNEPQNKPVILPPVNSTALRSCSTGTRLNPPWRPPGPTRSSGFSQGACCVPTFELGCLRKTKFDSIRCTFDKNRLFTTLADRLWETKHIIHKKLTRRSDNTRTWHRSLLLPLLRLTPQTEGFPWDDLRKILHQSMAKVQNDEEILPKVSTPLSRAHERYRRQTDLR